MSRPNNGHPYGRLSTDPQAKGHGEKRQKTEDFQGFCELFGFVLSNKVWFDKGVSAFDESNWDDDAELGRFVREAQRGVRVRRGDVLIVEDWDRLARLPWTRVWIRVAELFECGIHLGDATRMRLIRYDSEDPGDAVDLIFGTSRGHGESKRKSVMVQKAKDDRRRNTAEGKVILTRCLPPWIHIVPCDDDDPDGRWYGSVKNRQWGKLALREPQAGIIREIVRLRKQGLGPVLIEKEMISRGWPNPSGNEWRAEKVSALLSDRRLIGELPPARFKAAMKRIGQGKVDHPAVTGYYPPVISESDFYAMKASSRGGKVRRGRDAALPNPFKGMIRDALSGQTYYVQRIRQRDKKY
ncbi:MAG: recombinase family protein [Gemmataceae bacterium]